MNYKPCIEEEKREKETREEWDRASKKTREIMWKMATSIFGLTSEEASQLKKDMDESINEQEAAWKQHREALQEYFDCMAEERKKLLKS